MADSELKITMVPSQHEEPVSNEVKRKFVLNKKSIWQSKHWLACLSGVCGAIFWIVFFSLGILINSSQYRKPLETHFSIYNFIMTILTFAPCNMAILCLISAFTGGCASLLIIKRAQKVLGSDKQTNPNANSRIYMTENPFSAMLRGMVVYFIFLTGVFITSSTALLDPTAQSYAQAAGVVSMLSFLVGYDPSMFLNLINIAEKIKTKEPDSEEGS